MVVESERCGLVSGGSFPCHCRSSAASTPPFLIRVQKGLSSDAAPHLQPSLQTAIIQHSPSNLKLTTEAASFDGDRRCLRIACFVPSVFLRRDLFAWSREISPNVLLSRYRSLGLLLVRSLVLII